MLFNPKKNFSTISSYFSFFEILNLILFILFTFMSSILVLLYRFLWFMNIFHNAQPLFSEDEDCCFLVMNKIPFYSKSMLWIIQENDSIEIEMILVLGALKCCLMNKRCSRWFSILIDVYQKAGEKQSEKKGTKNDAVFVSSLSEFNIDRFRRK